MCRCCPATSRAVVSRGGGCWAERESASGSDPRARGGALRGTVLSVDDKDVLVDVGFKSEGIIALSEFPDPSSIKVGDTVEVFLEKMENQDGLVVLSKQRADFVRVWDRVKDAYDQAQVVEG